MLRPLLTAFSLLLYLPFHFIIYNQYVIPAESAVFPWHDSCNTLSGARSSALQLIYNFLKEVTQMRKIFKNNIWFMALLLVVLITGCGGGGGDAASGGGPGPAGAAPDLGTAGTYGIFASADAGVTLTNPSTLVDGDVGLMDGLGTCTNCDGTTVTGSINNGNAAAAQAQIDFAAAYTDASTRTTNLCTLAAPTEIAAPQGACTGYTDPPGSIGPTTFPTYRPGLYWSASSIGLGVGKLIVLDAAGNANAVFIFQASTAITTGSYSIVLLMNGAQAKNVFWVAGSAATLGVSSTFSGTVIADSAAINVLGGTSGSPTLVEGRLFSNGAAATVGAHATITVPAP